METTSPALMTGRGPGRPWLSILECGQRGALLRGRIHVISPTWWSLLMASKVRLSLQAATRTAVNFNRETILLWVPCLRFTLATTSREIQRNRGKSQLRTTNPADQTAIDWLSKPDPEIFTWRTRLMKTAVFANPPPSSSPLHAPRVSRMMADVAAD